MKYISLALFILAGALNAATITVPTVVDATHISTTAPITVTSANTANTIVYRDASGNFIAGTITANVTGNASTATALSTARSIYGNNFDGTAALTGIIASTYGGTGNGFTKFTGPTTSEKVFTLPNASATVLTSNDVVSIAQGGTGQTTRQAALNALAALSNKGEILYHDGTNVTTLSAGTSGYVLTADTTAGVKWAAASGGGGSVDTTANYTWTGTHEFDSISGGNTYWTFSGTRYIKIHANSMYFSSNAYLNWTNGTSEYSEDTTLHRQSAGIIELLNPSASTGAALRLHDMTAPSTPSDGGIIYAASGELHALDAGGHDTVFSPHPKDAPPEMYMAKPGVEQFFKSINWYTGQIFWQNVDAATPGVHESFADYNARFGYHEGNVGYLKTRDWDADQQRFADDRAAQIAAQAKRQTDAATVLANPQATKQQKDEALRVVNEPALAPYVKKANPYK